VKLKQQYKQNNNMSNQKSKKEMSLFESFTASIGEYINSLSLWEKELQMIIFSMYIILSCITTIYDHIVNFNTTYPMKLVDISVFFVMFVLIIVNVGFIYGCFTKNRVLLFLTPAIPNFVLIYVFFPKFHAFFLPLNGFLKAYGLQDSTFSRIINNLGSLTLIRVIYLLPIILYTRFLYNSYTDDFIECLEEIREIEKKEAEEAKKAEEEQQAQENNNEANTTEETNEDNANEDNINEENINENENTDIETKKNN